MALCSRSLFLPLALLLAWAVRAQQNEVPLSRDFDIELERSASLLDARQFTGLKPVLESRTDLSDVLGYRVDTAKYFYDVTEKLFRDHLFIVDEDEFHLTVDPLFQFETGNDFGDVTPYADTNRYYFNTRGIWIKADFGKKLSFQTMLHETQALVPQYLYLDMVRDNVVSGQGRVKLTAVRRIDFGWSQASVGFAPVKWLNIQLGHGRHFVGHGYRSVLLSDHSVGSPYLQFSVRAWKDRLQYTTWHTKLQHGVRKEDRLPTGSSSESMFGWMRARFNHLAIQLGRAELGLFESTIFRNIDENGVMPFDALELNPVIGVNTLVHGFNGPYKNLVGVDAMVKVVDKVSVYGQFATDDPAQQRYAWQAGLHVFDLVKRDIHLQLEYNAAKPFMYMDDPVQLAYMHSGLPMAHPMGANFDEAVAILDIGFLERFRVQGKVNLATYHEDSLITDNHGIDLDKPDMLTAPNVAPAQERQLTYLDLNASYLINPVTNLRFVVGLWRRDVPGTADNFQSSYVYVSLRTGLFNRYYDL